MQPIELISQDLFDKIRSRFSNLEMGDEGGNVTIEARKARFFDFDFVIEGNKLGRISISINEPGSLKIFYSQGLLTDQSAFVSETWYDFLKEMRNFSKRRMLRFDTRDITKSNLKKADFHYLSASSSSHSDSMTEAAMYGSKKSSYYPLDKALLIIRHKKAIEEETHGARSRNISTIFIQNGEGERYKFPFPYLNGAKAMLRHVANGGRPHDEHGNAIVNLCQEMAHLSSFRKEVSEYDSMNETGNAILLATEQRLTDLKNTISKLSNQRFYQTWKDSNFEVNPNDQVLVDEATRQIYRDAFTRTVVPETIDSYIPAIYNVMSKCNTLDLNEYTSSNASKVRNNKKNDKLPEIRALEEWSDSLSETTTLTHDIVSDLIELIDSDPKTGLDGTNAIMSLNNIGIDDPTLEKMIKDAGPNGDLKTVIIMWLEHTNQHTALELINADRDGSTEDIPDTATPEEPSIDDLEKELPPPTKDATLESILVAAGLLKK